MSLYHTDPIIRESIDRYLKRNAARQANLGLDSTDQERYIAKRAWENDLIEIAKLDSEFAYKLHAQDD